MWALCTSLQLWWVHKRILQVAIIVIVIFIKLLLNGANSDIICFPLIVQSMTKSGLTGTVPMSTVICVLCFKFQIQKGTLGTKLDTCSILCFIHEKCFILDPLTLKKWGSQLKWKVLRWKRKEIMCQ